jgi:hypothetical protein
MDRAADVLRVVRSGAASADEVVSVCGMLAVGGHGVRDAPQKSRLQSVLLTVV